MKLKILTCLSALAAAALFSGAKEAPKKATLKIDSSPVAEGRPGVVTSYADVIEPAQKAVVSVYSTKIERERIPPYFRQFFGDSVRERKEEGLGSGVIVTPDGYILTNNHVVEGADTIKVALPDNRELKGKVVGTDPKTDVAVIKIEADNLPAITLADSDRLRVGDVVFAVGNPLGVGQTVTTGIVSAKGRQVHMLDDVQGYEDFIQTDAAINMGNSGGALIDAKGRLVGINSVIVSTTSGSMGLGFAIPVNLAAGVMQSLIETGKVARGYLGVSVEPLQADLAEAMAEVIGKDSKGMAITNVTRDSPAAKAGLKPYDVIIAINDKPVDSLDAMRLIIAQSAPGTKVKVKYVRDKKTSEIEITLGKLSEDGAAGGFLAGISLSRVNDDLRSNYKLPDEIDGLVVTEVADSSPYADRFRAGMVIVQVNRVAVTEVGAARELLHPGKNFCLIWDRGSLRFVAFKYGE